MDHAVVVRGRLTGQVIELDEPAGAFQGPVEVIVRGVTPPSPPRPDFLEVLASLPGGSLRKDEIDQRLADERSDWDERDGRLPVSLREVTATVIERGTDLRARYGFKTPDALHLATALEAGATSFVTGDANLGRCVDLAVEVLTIPVGP